MLAETRKFDLRPDLVSYNSCVSFCGKVQGGWLTSVGLLSAMDAETLAPDVFSLSSAIGSCEGAWRWVMALGLLVAMHLRRIQAHMLSYNSAMNVSGNSSQWLMALSLFACAACHEGAVDIVSYNSMLQGQGCTWAVAIRHLMRSATRAGLRLTLVSYTTALNAAEGSWTQALQLLASMQLAPNSISYNSTLRALPDFRWTFSLSLMQRMKASRMVPDGITLSCASANWLPASRLLVAMIAQKHEASTISLNSIINACERGGQWQLATRVVSGMLQSSVADMLSCSLAIRACQANGQLTVALELLRRAQKLHLCDVLTFNSTIGVCHSGGSWVPALRLLQRMAALGLRPDVISYSSVISVCERAAQWTLALMVLSAMRTPDLIGFNSALSACEKAGRLRAALRLLSSAEALHLLPDVISFNSVISTCAEGGRWLLALGLFVALRARQAATEISYNSMISTCEGRGWPTALRLLSAMGVEGLVPDVASYSSAAATCTSSARWQEITGILVEMAISRFWSAVTTLSCLQACELARETALTSHLFLDLAKLAMSNCRQGSKGAHSCRSVPPARSRRSAGRSLLC